MKCSQCLGPLRVARTRLNSTPVWEPAVSEERLKALESLYESVKGLEIDVNTYNGETRYTQDVNAYKDVYEAVERLESAE